MVFFSLDLFGNRYSYKIVIPAQAGIQTKDVDTVSLAPRLCGGDAAARRSVTWQTSVLHSKTDRQGRNGVSRRTVFIDRTDKLSCNL